MDLDYDELRRWVRGELAPEDRRRVGAWLIRSRDPRVPDLLHAIAHEWDEERADVRLLAGFPSMSFAVDLWRRLWSGGTATYHPLVPAGAAPLLGARLATDTFRFVDRGRQVVVEVDLAGAWDAVVFATTDAGDEHRVGAVAGFGGTWLVTTWNVDPHEGRVTFWLCRASPGTAAVRSATVLSDIAGDPAVEVVAARWEPPE